MGDLSTSFARFASYQAPHNPMSSQELSDAMYRRGISQVGGMLEAAITSIPGTGLTLQTLGYAAGTAQAYQDASDRGDSLWKGALSGLLYGSATAEYANNLSLATSGRQLLTRSGKAFTQRAGWVGVAITVIDVFGVPLVEFGARNTGTQPMGSRWLKHEWESNYRLRIEAFVKTYNAKGCGEVLGNK